MAESEPETNELHASGEFYAAHLARFKCEWCWQRSPFLIEMFNRKLRVGYSCCPACATRLADQGWINTVKVYEQKP